MALAKKTQTRLARKARIRKHIEGSTERPRLSIFRSTRYIYAQIIDDAERKTLVVCSSLEDGMKGKLKRTNTREAAKEVGKEIAERAKSKNIKSVVFDRSGFVYHGRVQALAEGAREAGLQF